MNNTKKTKLSSITNECEEFHPLLNKLLNKLPNVIDVEYRHGSDEMGADFVVSKKDETLKITEYIGVIAKVGPVVQDYSDIERQIEECEVPRTYFGGKKKIRITEVWVMITKHITQGAQDKIYEKFKSRKITFIDGSHLERLIDEHLPAYWTELTLELGDYLSTIRVKTKEIDQSTSLVPFLDRDFYIEPDICEIDNTDYYLKKKPFKKRSEIINIYEKIDRQQIIFIEGGMGSGKSKLIRHLVDHFANPDIYLEKKLIPVFTTYKRLLDKFNGSIEQLIKNALGERLIKEVKEPNCLVLIDAVDEKNLSSDEQVQSLAKLINDIKSLKHIKAIITSRFLKEFEKSDISERICKCEIRPLSIKKTIDFLTFICTRLNITSRIIEDIKKSQLFKELPRSPISAILLAKLLQDNTQDLPSNMTELYSKYIELTLGRWDIDKGLQSQKEYQALDNIIMQFAAYMVTNEMPAIAVEEIKQMFVEYLKARNLDINSDELFDKMVNRCEIITLDQDTCTLTFKHRTFAEFFYARSLSNGKQLEIDQRAFQPYWMNTFFFYIGILKDCPQILTKIFEMEPDSEPKRWIKVANMANYFLAAYTSPYEIITKGLIKVMIDAAILYKDIVEKKIDSFFSQWPRMYILWFMQILIRQGYSYEYLKNAMEEAALRINEEKLDDDLRAYAIFFLNVAYIDTTSKDSLDFLIKERIGKLPIDLQLAVRHESENIKEKTLLMKKQEKYFKRIIKDNRNLKSQIETLYEKPIVQKPVKSIFQIP